MKRKKHTNKELITFWACYTIATMLFVFANFFFCGTSARQIKPGYYDGTIPGYLGSVEKGYMSESEFYRFTNECALAGGYSPTYLVNTVIPGHYISASTIDTLIASGVIGSEYDGMGYDEVGGNTPTSPSKPEEPKKHEHNYTKELTTVPTCTTDGEYTYTCSCGDSYTQQIIAPGHDWEEEERVEPVCEIAGYIKYTCKLCGESMREDIPALEHNYILTETIEPACSEDGYLVYTCENCGEEKREVLEKTNHPNTEWVNAKESGFFTAGREDLTCKDCGEVLETKTVPAKQDWRIWAGGLLLLIVIGTCVTLIVKKAHKKK